MKYIRYIILLITVVFFGQCAEDIPDSVIITFPSITLNGEPVVLINAGDAYVDEGALAFVGETMVEVTVENLANPNVSGVYVTSYRAQNEEGFEASATRTVVVLDPAPSSLDLTGIWARSNGNPNNIVKLSDRLYQANNAGGAFPDGDPRNMVIQFYNVNDVDIFIPFQENTSPSGISVAGINDGTNRINSPNQLQWSLNASAAYGTFVRVFDRQ